MRILIALLSIPIGLTLLFGGYRAARIIIPLWGFLTGLSVGGSVAADMSNRPFLGAATGLLVGLITGLVLGILAFCYYYAAVIVLVASIGYWLGTSMLLFVGVDPGFLSALFGLLIGAIMGGLALVANAPKYVLIVATSFAGAMGVVGGFLLLFNQISLAQISYDAIKESITNYSTLVSVMIIVLTIAGVIVQDRLARYYDFETWRLGADRTDHPKTPHSTSVHYG